MHRFFISKNSINAENQTAQITDRDDIKHAAKALRIEVGEKIELCDSEGIEHICEVQLIETDAITCAVLSSEMNKRESNVHITLYQGLPKSDKLEMIIQKTTELGVDRITPVQMKRSIAKWKDDKSGDKKVQRWNKIAFEASKQSKRGQIPEVGAPVTMKQVFRKLESYDLILMPYENESAQGFGEILNKNADSKRVAIIIGPEGGIADEEVKLLTENGAKSVKMGPRIMRTETAGVTAVALVQYVLGDLSGV